MTLTSGIVRRNTVKNSKSSVFNGKTPGEHSYESSSSSEFFDYSITTITLPDFPKDEPFFFELIMFSYSLLALLLIYLHLYRSVWWLPHSYNQYAMNFYLMDVNIFVFCSLLHGRRLLWMILKGFLGYVTPLRWKKRLIFTARTLLSVFIFLVLSYIYKSIISNHSLTKSLTLVYPLIIYFLLFGCFAEPFYELVPNQSGGSEDKSLFSNYQTSNIHQVLTPDEVRSQATLLTSDFLLRCKQVLFNSGMSAYYGTFVPICFVQSSLYYEEGWINRHILLIWIGSLSLYVIQIFPSSYNNIVHKTAMLLGHWNKMDDRLTSSIYPIWKPLTCWRSKSIVRHGKDLFKAGSHLNLAEPGHSKFYPLFQNPCTLIGSHLILQSALVLTQHLSLSLSSYWYQLLSEAILLFANYYVLFKLCRAYFVLSKLFSSRKGWDLR